MSYASKDQMISIMTDAATKTKNRFDQVDDEIDELNDRIVITDTDPGEGSVLETGKLIFVTES